VILYTGWADPAEAVRAIKFGAEDYLSLPFPPNRILDAVAGAAAKERIPATGDRQSQKATDIVANSDAMKAVLAWIDRVAPSDAPVLLLGETGTGKELMARRLHEMSLRSREPFVPVNCGGIPSGLAEAELFGHRRGAFTSANADRLGLAEEAHRGTLFLDEIGDLPIDMQVALLRFLDHGEFRRVGENRVRTADVRIVAATNRSIPEDLRSGRFRQDLFFRLSAGACRIPPLRERLEDLNEYVRLWCRRAEPSASARVVTPDGLARLRQHDWPGNTRELANVLTRAALLRGPAAIDGETVGAALLSASFTTQPASDADERTVLLRALQSNQWHRGRTAAALGMNRTTLWRRIRELKLE
jgi:DNA-binding NtrC family response regulator